MEDKKSTLSLVLTSEEGGLTGAQFHVQGTGGTLITSACMLMVHLLREFGEQKNLPAEIIKAAMDAYVKDGVLPPGMSEKDTKGGETQ